MKYIGKSTTFGWLRILAISALAISSITGVAKAQDDPPPRPLFARLFNDLGASTPSLPTWNGTFTFQGQNFSFNMVGTSPDTNTATTIPVYLIPVKIVLTRLGQPTFDPMSIPS